MDGFTVDTARDGIEGLEKLLRQADLIILDMLMPRLDGLQFLARYNQRPPDQRATVLVASNKSSTEQINKAKQLGAAEYLIKSKLTPDDLVVHVRKYLSRSSLRRYILKRKTPRTLMVGGIWLSYAQERSRAMI